MSDVVAPALPTPRGLGAALDNALDETLSEHTGASLSAAPWQANSPGFAPIAKSSEGALASWQAATLAARVAAETARGAASWAARARGNVALSPRPAATPTPAPNLNPDASPRDLPSRPPQLGRSRASPRGWTAPTRQLPRPPPTPKSYDEQPSARELAREFNGKLVRGQWQDKGGAVAAEHLSKYSTSRELEARKRLAAAQRALRKISNHASLMEKVEANARGADALREEYDQKTGRAMVRSLEGTEGMSADGVREIAVLLNKHMALYQHHYLTATARGSQVQRGGDTFAGKLEPGEPSWYKLFLHIDVDRSGTITYDEFERELRGELKLAASQLPEAELRALWKALDQNCDGFIGVAEFGRFMRMGAAADPIRTRRGQRERERLARGAAKRRAIDEEEAIRVREKALELAAAAERIEHEAKWMEAEARQRGFLLDGFFSPPRISSFARPQVRSARVHQGKFHSHVTWGDDGHGDFPSIRKAGRPPAVPGKRVGLSPYGSFESRKPHGGQWRFDAS